MLSNFVTQVFVYLLHLAGWSFTDEPSVKKGIVLVAGHTSNWDFPLGLLFSKAAKMKIRYTIKKEWIRFPFSYFFLSTGAIGIQRKFKTGEQKVDYSSQMIQMFEKSDQLFLVITPEGTRSANGQWKKGFYRIAKKANVPLVMGYIDYKKKEVGCHHIIYPKETYEETQKEINDFYAKINPKYPEKFILPKL